MLIQKDNLFCKGVKDGWKRCVDIDPSTLPKRCVAIEIEEDGERFLCVHHMTQNEPSNGWAKSVFKKLKLSDSPNEIWEAVFTKTEFYNPSCYDEKISDLLTEGGLRNLLVELFVP